MKTTQITVGSKVEFRGNFSQLARRGVVVAMNDTWMHIRFDGETATRPQPVALIAIGHVRAVA